VRRDIQNVGADKRGWRCWMCEEVLKMLENGEFDGVERLKRLVARREVGEVDGKNTES